MYEGGADIIDDMIEYYLDDGADGFLGNNDAISQNPFPNGIDIEIFNYRMLCWAKENIKDKINLEHCATSFYKHSSPFSVKAYNNMNRISKFIPSFTLDTDEDYQLLLKLTKNYDACQNLNAAIEKTNYEMWR
jgi:spore coat polysaccharide biosynthesis protein SpsF (cytidylyltransferase family)